MENGAQVVADQFFSTTNLILLLGVLVYFVSLCILLLAHHNAMFKILQNVCEQMKCACAFFKITYYKS